MTFVDSGCKSDSECDAGINGRCIGYSYGGIDGGYNLCSYDTCFSDDACSGMACTCREDFPKAGNIPDTCAIVGNCRVDSDCPNGQLCSPSYVPGCSPFGFFCRTPQDECIADVDCQTSSGFCGWDVAKGHWACRYACVDS